MSGKIPCAMHWSGGKDSALALWYALKDPKLDVRFLATTVSKEFNRVSMHGLRYELLLLQVEMTGLELETIFLPETPDMAVYNKAMRDQYRRWRQEGIEQVIFGDIFLEDLRVYREEQLAECGLKAVFPLWQKPTENLLDKFLKLGFKTVIICAEERLADFTGKILIKDLVNRFPADVDVCGEHGEFHTFVFDGPLFSSAVPFVTGEKTTRYFPTPGGDRNSTLGFTYVDLLLPNNYTGKKHP